MFNRKPDEIDSLTMKQYFFYKKVPNNGLCAIHLIIPILITGFIETRVGFIVEKKS